MANVQKLYVWLGIWKTPHPEQKLDKVRTVKHVCHSSFAFCVPVDKYLFVPIAVELFR
jgi:hypothetical protein